MKQSSILAISENEELLKTLRGELKKDYEIITFNTVLDGMDMLRESDFDLLLLDENLGGFSFSEASRKLRGIGKEIVILSIIGKEDEDLLKEIKELGIYNYILNSSDFPKLKRIIEPALKYLEVVKEKKEVDKKLIVSEESHEIITQNTKMKELKNKIDDIAESDTSVLIIGEAGTGKEAVAKEIYKKSHRRRKRFFSINCGALSEKDVENEMFGYERGAFPGANISKKGILEKADGGTVFLDEISALNLKSQAKLLRVIEYGELRRVGGHRTTKIDIRFLISSSKNLEEQVKKGKFRKDLYHRLTTILIEVPPLRERKEDIPLLANYFLNKLVVDIHKDMFVISSDAMKYLIEYMFPGNIRELKNIIERMVILASDKIVGVDDLPLELKMKSDTLENKTITGIGPLKEILENELYELADVEKVVIGMALQKTRWNKQEAAKVLGIGRTTLYEKIRKYKLDRRNQGRDED